MKRGFLMLCIFSFAMAAADAQRVALVKAAPGVKVAEAAQDTTQWGYVDPVNATPKGFAMMRANSMSACYFVDGSGPLKGAKIVAVDVPASSTPLKGFTAWVRTEMDGENIASKEYTGELAQDQFGKVVFDEPIDLPAEGLYVGYDGNSNTIACADADSVIPKSAYLQVKGRWQDLSSFGALRMQVELTGVKFPEGNLARFSAFDPQVTVKGDKDTITLKAFNEGDNAITSIDYTLDIDGVKMPGHTDFETPIPVGFHGNEQTVAVPFTAPDEAKDYDVKLNIDKVNSADNVNKADTQSAVFTNLLRRAVRRTVMETSTDTGWGFCPKEWSSMKTLREKYPDTFIGIAVHHDNSKGNDPMYVGTDYPTVSPSSNCTLNRGAEMDPYFGSYKIGKTILSDVENAGKVLPFADVTVSGTFNADSAQVNATAAVEYLTARGDYSVAYVLTADSLYGEGDAWKQTNFYKQNNWTKSVGNVQDDIPLLGEFCQDGKYFENPVALVFDDVEIASSYVEGENQAPALDGDPVAGKKVSTSYTLTLPADRTELMKALKYDRLYVSALVIDNQTKEIVNAVRAKVGGESTNGITSAGNGITAARVVARYTLDGRRIQAPVKGLNIVKMSDGTIRKVMMNE